MASHLSLSNIAALITMESGLYLYSQLVSENIFISNDDGSLPTLSMFALGKKTGESPKLKHEIVS